MLDRLIMAEEQSAPGEERMHKGPLDGALHHPLERAPGGEESMDVDPSLHERVAGALRLPFLPDEEEIDIRLLPDDVIRQASQEHRGENIGISLHLLDQ